MIRIPRFYTVIALLGLAASGSWAVDLGTHAQCHADDSEFRATQIVATPRPAGVWADQSNAALRIALTRAADGSVDVFFVQLQGAVKRYNGRTGSIDSLGMIENDHRTVEHGLLGIALRNDFPQNPWLYFFFSFAAVGKPASFRLAAIRLAPDLSKLDLSTQKILLDIPILKGGWNTGGAMRFDAYDDLWATVGDNMLADSSAGNTADLRGGILRIHPDGSPRGYSIPSGNFAERSRAFFLSQGDAELAAVYADTARVRPELYIKGTDNPYTLFVDPVRRWLAWADVGPDQGRNSEEYNLAKQPAFAGWPYYAGEEDMTGIRVYQGAGTIQPGSTKSKPINGLGLGAVTLPPVMEPLMKRSQACAMAGPIIRYDGTLADTGQAPPQLNRKWLVSDCLGTYGWHLLTLDDSGKTVLYDQAIFKQFRTNTLVDLQQGPDGKLYYVDWATGGIYRIDYTGSCRDPALVPERTGCADPAASNYDPRIPKEYHDGRLCTVSTRSGNVTRAPWLRLDPNSVSISSPGPHRLMVTDLQGRILARFAANGPALHSLSGLPAAGLYRIRVWSAYGIQDLAVPYLGH